MKLFEIPKEARPSEYDNYEEWFEQLPNKMRSISLTVVNQ